MQNLMLYPLSLSDISFVLHNDIWSQLGHCVMRDGHCMSYACVVALVTSRRQH